MFRIGKHDFTIDRFLNRVERALIETALASTNGNVKRTSEILGLKRTSLDGWLKRNAVDRNDFRDIFEQEELEQLQHRRNSLPHPGRLRTLILKEVLAVLKLHNGNRTTAARDLGVCLRTIRSYVRELKAMGLDVPAPPLPGRWRDSRKP